MWILLISSALITVREDLVELYINLVGTTLDSVYSYLDERPGLNRLIVLTFLIFGTKWISSIYRSHNFSFVSLSASFVLILCVNHWPGSYLAIVKWFTYKWLLNLLLTSLLGVESILFIRHILRKPPVTYDEGLVIQSPEYITDGRKVYAGTIAELIFNSPIRDRSFAVGVVGEWGAGKTLILSELEKRLADKAIVIKFKPWNSKSADHLIDDFFSELRKGINKNDRNIGPLITRYAAHIIDLDVNKRLSSLAKIGSIATNELVTLDSLKDDVEKLLIEFDRNVIVLIDDLDRLDSDELFETLRLIRNTADFRNVAYVVTFDRDYVSHMLEGKGIANPERYLEKIFTTTVSLPSYEPHILVLLIYQGLRKRYGGDSIEFRDLSKYITLTWSHSSSYILNDYITTFRDAIRFTNHIIQDLEILKRNTPTYYMDLNMREWFYLELLKFRFPQEYFKLRSFPNEYLDLSFDYTRQGYISIKKDSKEKSEKRIELPVSSILSLIFGEERAKAGPNSLIYEHNYYNYFALRVLSTEIKQSEFNNLIKDSALDIEYVLRQWKGRNPSVNKSVLAHFKNYAKNTCDAVQGKRFIRAMIQWCVLTEDTKMISVVKRISYLDFPLEIQDCICTVFYDELRAALPCVSSLKYACLLAMSSAPAPFDPSKDPDLPDRNILTNQQAKELSSIILDALVEKNPDNLAVNDLANENSNIRVLLKYLVQEIKVNDYPEFENYIVDHLIHYIDNNIQNVPEAKGSNLSDFVEEFSPEWTEQPDVDEHIADEVHVSHMRHFGKTENIRHIITEWFDATDEDKERAIRKVLWYDK